MNRTDLPAPFYAAAGAGALAYRKLRRLPDVAARSVRTAGRTVDGLRQRIALRERDLATLRESAQRGRTMVAARAAEVQERAATGYRRLVAHGEQVMAERTGAATGRTDRPAVEVEVGPVEGAGRATPGGPATQ
jgi:hypothetical protein